MTMKYSSQNSKSGWSIESGSKAKGMIYYGVYVILNSEIIPFLFLFFIPIFLLSSLITSRWKIHDLDVHPRGHHPGLFTFNHPGQLIPLPLPTCAPIVYESHHFTSSIHHIPHHPDESPGPPLTIEQDPKGLSSIIDPSLNQTWIQTCLSSLLNFCAEMLFDFVFSKHVNRIIIYRGKKNWSVAATTK